MAPIARLTPPRVATIARMSDLAGGGTENGKPTHLISTTALFWALGFTLFLYGSRRSAGSEFFFDEAWRVDIIRSSNPFSSMRGVNAPIPPLWPWILHISSAVLGDGPGTLRVQGTALAALCPAFAGQLMRVLPLPRNATPRASWAGGLFLGSIGTIGTATLLNGTLVPQYFNDYAFQGALVLVLVILVYFADRGWMSVYVVLPVTFLVTVGSIAGLFVLPAVLLWALLSPLRLYRRLLAPWFGLMGVTAALLHVGLYRHQVDSGLTGFWSAHVLHGSSQTITGALLTLVRTAGSIVVPYFATDRSWIPFGTGLLLGAGFGFVAIRRTWPWLGRIGVSAWIVAAMASVGVSWPVTAVRVNVPFLVLWFVAALIGLRWLVYRLTSRGADAILVAAVLPMTAISFGHTFWDPSSAFAKGINSDMQIIRDSTATRVVVVGYHFMSAPYLHDGLINRRSDADRYRFIQDTLAEPLTDRDLMVLVEQERLDVGDEVWCVIPFEVGEETMELACALDEPEFEMLASVVGAHSRIIGFRVPSSG